MTLERKIARTFALDDETWLKYANSWSVILRFTVLPLLILAFWSRFYLGWEAIIPIVFAIFWTWVNPRIFNIPRSLNHWASKAVLGERVWMNRDKVPIPVHHRTLPNILSAIAGVGMLFIIWGILVFDPWPTLFGTMFVYMGKVWFLDRMVWLWQDMQDKSGEYQSWKKNQEK